MKFENKYVSEIVCLIQYKDIDSKVRHRAADAETAFSEMFSGQTQQTNVPDSTDPNIPRLLFQTGAKQLFISQKACQLKLSFERNKKTIDEQLLVAQKNLLSFQNSVLKFIPKDNLGECAIVISVNIPTKENKVSLLQHIYNRFFKTDQQGEFGELASYSFKVGYKTASLLYVNYETDIYEVRSLSFAQPTPLIEVLKTDPKNVPVVEEGIGVRVDINNKPKANSEPYVYSGIDELTTVAFDFIENKIDTLMGISEQ
jgi:hypothetical protein